MEIDRETLIQTFTEEAGEQLVAIEEALVQLEQQPGNSELLSATFRHVHTLKGNAAVVGFSQIKDYAHVMEDVLEHLNDGRLALGPHVTSTLLSAVDTLRGLLGAAVAGAHQEPPSVDALVRLLSGAQPATPLRQPSGAALEPAPQELLTARSPSLRVSVHKLDRMLDLMSELTVARGRTRGAIDANRGLAEVRDAFGDEERLVLELQEQVMAARMVPIGPVLRQHQRTVRDLALALGKKARLVLEGEDVELDTAACDAIRAPLVHLLRNALDHGLEAPEERRAAGKDEVGTLRLSASHRAGSVVIELSDDGRGPNRERIAERVEKLHPGLSTRGMPDAELFQFLFEPGFSTARAVSEYSGRGVGLDVVKGNMESLRGTVLFEGEAGKGTKITLQFPLTLAIINGFSVSAEKQTYVVPLESVVECVELPHSERKAAQASGVIELRGKPLPYLRLADAMGLQATGGQPGSVLIVRHGEQLAGLVVDELLGDGQTVIKPLPRPYSSAQSLAGAALLGDGTVALVVDVPSILKNAAQAAGEASARGQVQP